MANSKLTPECIEIIVKAIKEGFTDKEAYTAAGISKATFYTALNDNLNFTNAIKNAREERTKIRCKMVLDEAERGLIALLRGCEYDETKTETKTDPKTGETFTNITTTHKKILPNATAVLFALCNRDPSRWQNKVTGEIKQEIEQTNYKGIDTTRLKDETIEAMIKELEAGKA